jgi:hypothetical protein
MRKIIVNNPKNDDLVNQLVCFYESFKNLSKNEKVEFDLSKIKWFSPFLILPLTSYINKTKSSYILGLDQSVNSYLDAIRFPLGINSLTEFSSAVQQTKNYVPISVLEKDQVLKRNKLENCFQDMIYKIAGEIKGAKNAVIYPIMELVANIFHHSKENKGYVFGQFYPNKNYLDICIIDTGRGVAKTYADELNLIITDKEAITKVMNGVSTKKERERGYGVRTSKDVVCKSMKGTFIFLSGSSVFIAKNNKEKFVDLPEFNWQGVIIAYRIPKPAGEVDIYPFIGD